MSKGIGHLHDDVIWLQLPECFEASYCIQYFLFCEESLVRDTNLHYQDCSEMHSGSCSQITSSCKCPIDHFRIEKKDWDRVCKANVIKKWTNHKKLHIKMS